MTGWYRSTPAAPGVTLTTEPFVNGWYRANCYTVAGREADLVFDFGCGIRPFRPALPLSGKPVVAVASHAHIDHVGGFHELADRRGHAAEAAGFATMAQPFTLKEGFRTGKYGPSLLAAPEPGYDLLSWDLVPAPLTATLAEGDRIDLGDRVFTVLHLPGHSPGGIGLLDQASGLLLSGDAIYDEELLDELPGSSIPDYLMTMARLSTLDCALVLGGHGPAMTRARMHQIARAYIDRRG